MAESQFFSKEAEIGVLGGLLILLSMMPQVADLVETADFQDRGHRFVYWCLEHIYDKEGENGLNLANVAGQMPALAQLEAAAQWQVAIADPLAYLGNIVSQAPDAINLLTHAKQVSAISLRHSVYSAAMAVANLATAPRMAYNNL